MAYSASTQKSNLKTIIKTKLDAKDPINKKYSPTQEGEVQLDTICEAIADWLAGVIPTLTVNVTVTAGPLLLSAAPGQPVTGTAPGVGTVS